MTSRARWRYHAGWSLAALTGLGALLPAQEAAPTVALPVKLDPFVVTGSLIKRTDFEGPSPLLVITREEIARVAGTGLADVLRELPEVTSLGIQENATVTSVRGATALDLRSLGPANTLVLVDGRRQAPNGIAAGATTFVDINRFPVALIERVEVLRDGAAAVYGADATAGVVNIILRRDFSGTEIAARYGNYFATDGAETSWSLLTGGTRGRARATLGLTYSSRNAIAATDLPFTADADQTELWRALDPVKYAARLQPTPFGSSAFDQRSQSGPFATVAVPNLAQLSHPRNGLTLEAIRNPLTGATAFFLPGTGGVAAGTLGRLPNRASVPRDTNTGRPSAADFVPRAFPPGPLSNNYNYQEFVWITAETDRRGANARLEFDLHPRLTLYGLASWVRLDTRTQYAPSPISTFADNALLVPAANPYNPFGIPVFFTWRPVEVGAREVRVTSDSLNLLAGLQGSLGPKLEWDLGWTYSRNESADTQSALSESAVRAALARTTPDALNIFGGLAFANDPATLRSIKVDTTRSGDASTAQVDLRLTATELFALPWGPVGGSAGLEHRLERFNITNDERSSVLDDIIGASPDFGPTRARRDVQSLALELRTPLVRDGRHRWLRTAELSTAARFERFSDGYDSGIKPFVGLRLRPTGQLLLRASYGQVFRAPSLPQLFGGTIEQFGSGLEDLRRPPALTGDPDDSLSAPRRIRAGGNPRLEPENGTTRQAGVVVDLPGPWLRGLSLEFTHGIIAQDGVIRDALGLDFIRQNELGGTGDLVVREPGTETYTNTSGAPVPILAGPGGATRLVQPGESVTVPGRITLLLDAAVNLARQEVRYYDYGLRWRRATARWGDITLATQWTYFGLYTFQRQPSDPPFTAVGRTLPRYRGQGSLVWERARWDAHLGFNYTHRYRDLATDGWEVGRHTTYSAGVGHVFAPDSFLRGARVTLGVDNLFDRRPPLDFSGTPGFDPGFVGRPAGRSWFVALRQQY